MPLISPDYRNRQFRIFSWCQPRVNALNEIIRCDIAACYLAGDLVVSRPMSRRGLKSGTRGSRHGYIRRAYRFLARRPYSVLVFAALFCTLAAKLFHSIRSGLLGEYFNWIAADLSFLLMVQVIVGLVCFRWPRKAVIRSATVLAALVCTWSVINAGWLIRTGSQILPAVLAPLFRDPINTLSVVGINLVKMPAAAVALLGPSAAALLFFFVVLARPREPAYGRRVFVGRTVVLLIVVVTVVLARCTVFGGTRPQTGSATLRYNCQLRALMSIVLAESGRGSENPTRQIPACDELQIRLSPQRRQAGHNVVILVLEGIQYRYTSLPAMMQNQGRVGEADKGSGLAAGLTPHLAGVAQRGVAFTNARSSLTHTTKALFALLTGRYPSASHDIVEAVPADKPYASLATILGQLGYRTAFFQSAKGSFEARPGLVHNLGFDTFWAREDLGDPNHFIGYLACDEFSMLGPIAEWIKAEDGPFLLAIMCSVTHDPYEAPQWYDEPADKPLERYKQAIAYTDAFIGALDDELARLKLVDNTVFCIVGDHGEAFGEHGGLGHEGIGFDEVLRVPFVLRAPSPAGPARRVTSPVGSIDVTPTLLALLGFDVGSADFDGLDVLSVIPVGRKLYFSGWMGQSPAGFVTGDSKFVYDPGDGGVFVYGLVSDPNEMTMTALGERRADELADEIVGWRKGSVFRAHQEPSGKRRLFHHWLCRWNNRSCVAKYDPELYAIE